ncbi:hypothetical protein GCM10027566_13570 [Arachidicoccus ginsenosidivorans]
MLTPEQASHYVFESIRFMPESDGEGSTFQSYPRTGFIFSNRTSVEQTAVLGTELKSSSAFTFGSDLDSLLQKLDTVFIQVPVAFEADGKASLGTMTWPLVNNYTVLPLKKDPTRVVVAPFSKLTVTGEITEKVLKTNFMVTLREQNSDQQKRLKGSWSGTVPISEDLNYQVEDIK